MDAARQTRLQPDVRKNSGKIRECHHKLPDRSQVQEAVCVPSGGTGTPPLLDLLRRTNQISRVRGTPTEQLFFLLFFSGVVFCFALIAARSAENRRRCIPRDLGGLVDHGAWRISTVTSSLKEEEQNTYVKTTLTTFRIKSPEDTAVNRERRVCARC